MPRYGKPWKLSTKGILHNDITLNAEKGKEEKNCRLALARPRREASFSRA